MIPSVIMAAAFPKLSKFGKDKDKNFTRFFARLFFIFLFLAIIIFIPMLVFAPFLVETILGIQYMGSVSVLKVLIISLFAIYPGHLVTQALIALDAQVVFMYISLIGAFTNVGLNLVLIPRYGITGAAWATVIAEILITICCLLGIRYRLKRAPSGT